MPLHIHQTKKPHGLSGRVAKGTGVLDFLSQLSKPRPPILGPEAIGC